MTINTLTDMLHLLVCFYPVTFSLFNKAQNQGVIKRLTNSHLTPSHKGHTFYSNGSVPYLPSHLESLFKLSRSEADNYKRKEDLLKESRLAGKRSEKSTILQQKNKHFQKIVTD